MKEDAPGAAVQLFRDNKALLDVTQPEVKEMETTVNTVAYKYQAHGLVASLVRANVAPEDQLRAIVDIETSEKPTHPQEVLDLAKAIVQKNTSEYKAIKESEDDNVYQRGLIEISRDPKLWTKATSAEYQTLVKRKSDKAYYLWKAAEAAQRAHSENAAERQLQASIDRQYKNGIKRLVLNRDPNGMDDAKHQDPVFQGSLVRRRDGIIRAPSEDAVAWGRSYLAETSSKDNAKLREPRAAVSRRAWTVAGSLARLPSREAKQEWVSRVMQSWDEEALNKQAVPAAEWSDKLISLMSARVQTSEGFWGMFKGEMGYDEAWSLGLLDDAKQLPPEEQDNPQQKPGYQKPGVPPSNPAKPGYVRVRKGTVMGQVPEQEVDGWLLSNPGWSKD
jgi:hypothetical protein